MLISQQEKHVPPWVLGAQEGGEFNVFPDLPPATAAADLPSVQQAAREAEEAGATLKPLGVSGVLAPVVDVGLPQGAAVGARAFSDEPSRVADYAREVVSAYRRKRFLSAASHFPGLGTGS